MNSIASNIELLYDRAKSYTETSIELARLNAIDKTADLVSSLVTRGLVIMLFTMFTFFINVALSLFLGELLGKNYLGFLVVSVFYLIVCLIMIKWSNPIIKLPVTNLVIAKLLKVKSSDNH